MRKLLSGIAVVALCLGTASASYAGTIYACRKKIGGTIRIVGAKTVCLATETKMSWFDGNAFISLSNRLAALESHNHDDRYLEQSQRIVLTESPANFHRLSSSTLPTLVLQAGHVAGFTADNGVVIMPLTAPNEVGGTQYRLGTVEWCLAADATSNAVVTTAVVYHDQPGVPGGLLTTAVSDPTDRTMAGCYTLTVPPLSPRGFSLGLGLTGQTTNLTQAGIVLSGVRSTWVPLTGAGSVLTDQPPADAGIELPADARAFLGVD